MSSPHSALDTTRPARDESVGGDAALIPEDAAADDPAAGRTDAPGAPRAHAELTAGVVAVAKAAAEQEAGSANPVGDYLGAIAEDDVAVSAAFAAADRSYRGWYWSVTLALVDPEAPTISEVVLLPGEQALLAPPWVPWDRRIRAGDVGAGDLLPTPADDIRLVPGYVDSDDPAVKEVAYEFGFGRARVLSREGRDEAAQRWHDGPFGPDDPIAVAAQAHCVTCGFYVPLEGLLGMALGACANEFSPADGRVVDAEFGCGAHSDTVIDAPLISASTATVVDEFTLEVHRRRAVAPATALEAEPDLLVEVVGGPEEASGEAVEEAVEAADVDAIDVVDGAEAAEAVEAADGVGAIEAVETAEDADAVEAQATVNADDAVDALDTVDTVESPFHVVEPDGDFGDDPAGSAS